ncbi:MAG: hypothetical protein JSR82_21065 [Verrucomicrobia bacterium]|nr:hypothetical protein [Verrucomicrobiota bacterium]
MSNTPRAELLFIDTADPANKTIEVDLPADQSRAGKRRAAQLGLTFDQYLTRLIVADADRDRGVQTTCIFCPPGMMPALRAAAAKERMSTRRYIARAIRGGLAMRLEASAPLRDVAPR